MRRVQGACFAFLVVLAACEDAVKVEPAEGHVLLLVDTDAPLPRARAPGPLDPAPLFDRLRIQVYAPGATVPCEGCTNEFSIDEDLLRRGAASVGIAPLPETSGYRARVRMFSRRLTGEDGEPDPDAVLETVVALPVVGATGKIEASVVLHTDDVGTKVGSLEEPIEPTLGAASSSAVGTWPLAARVACAEDPPPGMVCVPGGAYWMGDRRKPWAVLPGHDVTRPRLVVLSPFFMDAHEVTAGEFRAQGKGIPAYAYPGGTTGATLLDYCTYAPSLVGRDEMPMNCLLWSGASAYCRRRGADLPTEAQTEYVAGGLQNLAFPWGEDVPACEDAVFSRLGYGLFANSTTTCRPAEPYGGPVEVGTSRRDRLALPTGTIVDIAGNVAEFQRDRWHRKDEPCWVKPGVYQDPVCGNAQPLSVDGDRRTVRGGNWLVTGGQLERTNRASAQTPIYASPEVGFRCVKPSAPLE